MLTLIDADSLACACRILGWNVPEQKKGNFKLFLKYIFRQLNSEDVEVSNYGSYSRYKKLHDHLRVRFLKKDLHLLVSNKNLNCMKAACLAETSFLRILFGETR